MISISEMNTLMVLEELLDGPKSIEELYEVLLIGPRKRPNVPLNLPQKLDDFLEIYRRHGTLTRVGDDDEDTKYQVNPQVVDVLRKRINEAFSPDVEAYLARIGEQSGRTDNRVQPAA